MRVLFLGAPIQKIVRRELPFQNRYIGVGHNTGNLLIGQSLVDELEVSEYSCGQHLKPDEVNERFDVIVIGSANFVFSGFDFAYLADYIEATKLPCVMAGLGAQAPKIGDGIGDIPAGTRRLLEIVSQRSYAIGVRGAFTANVLNDFGIQNVEVIGCPSLYRKLKRNLLLKPLPSADSLDEIKVSLNGSRDVVGHSGSPVDAEKVVARLLALTFSAGHPYVLQSEMPELAVLESEEPETGHLQQLEKIARKLNLPCDGSGFAQHVRNNFRAFYDLSEWDAYIREFDASIGGRFHGNLIALTNGVPAFIVTHDSRTNEMAETMSIPHCGVEDVSDQTDFLEYLKSADYEGFQRSYTQLYDRFANFLTNNGLKHKLCDAA